VLWHGVSSPPSEAPKPNNAQAKKPRRHCNTTRQSQNPLPRSRPRHANLRKLPRICTEPRGQHRLQQDEPYIPLPLSLLAWSGGCRASPGLAQDYPWFEGQGEAACKLQPPRLAVMTTASA
jgi:hypothetical protein